MEMAKKSTNKDQTEKLQKCKIKQLGNRDGDRIKSVGPKDLAQD
jgi:hypothetical protein